MQWLPLIVIIVYLGGTTLIGSMLAGRTKSAKEWALAGGGMGMMMVTVGIAGTRIGGAGTYGVAGDVIKGGVWNLWWYGITTFLALAIVGFFFAVPYRRLRLHTVSEIFHRRFGTRRAQALASFCVQTEYFIINIIEPFVIGAIIRGVTGMPVFWAIMIGGVIIVTYTSLGGLWGSAATNLIHCVVIIFGLSAVVLFGLDHLGGWDNVTQQVNARLAEADGAAPRSEIWWGFAGAGWLAVIGMFFSSAVHTPAASVYVNFSSAAKSERILLPAFLLAGLVAMTMPMLAGLIGIETAAKYGPGAGLRTYANVTRLATDIHPVIGGIALAAVLAAVISSGGPILLSGATMFVQDWLPSEKMEPVKKLRALRITTVVYGMFAALIAVGMASPRAKITVLELLLFGFAMVVPPAVAVGYLIYWKRTTEKGAFWGMLSGYVIGLIWFLLIEWATRNEFTAPEGSSAMRRLFHFCFVHRGEGIDPSYATTFVPLIVVPIVSLMTPEDLEGKEAFYETVSTPGDSMEAQEKAA